MATRSKEKKIRPSRRLLFWVVAVLALAGVALWYSLTSYKTVLARRIVKELVQYGLSVEALTVNKVQQDRIDLSDIRLGKERPLSVSALSAQFDPRELVQGKLRDIHLQGVAMQAYVEEGEWMIGGLEPLMQPAEEKEAGLPDFSAIRDRLPQVITAQSVQLQAADGVMTVDVRGDVESQLQQGWSNSFKGAVQLSTLTWSANAPLTAEINLLPSVKVDVSSPTMTVTAKPYSILLNGMTSEVTYKAAAWNIQTTVDSMVARELPYPLPPLKVKAVSTYAEKKGLRSEIALQDVSKTYRASLVVSAPPEEPDRGMVTVKTMQFPWGGGTVRVKGAVIPFALNQPVKALVTFEQVDLASLLGIISGDKISGTGKLSGTLPITYYPDGRIVIDEGTAKASDLGLISIPPSLLPGENPQLELARTTLENFHYNLLNITVSSNEQNESEIHLTIEGKNPDVHGERPIKLNITLGGDILPLIRQSILPMNDIKAFLKGGE